MSRGGYAASGLTHLELHGLLPGVKSSALRHLVARVVLLEAVGVGPHEHVAIAVRRLIPYLVGSHHALGVARDPIGYAVGLAWVYLHAKLSPSPSYDDSPSHCSPCIANLEASVLH